MNTQNSPRKKRRVLLLKGTGDSRKLLSVPSSPSASSLVQHPAPNRKKTRRTFSAKKRTKHPLKWVSKGNRYAKLSGRASASSTTRTHGTCFDNSPKPQLTSSSPTRPMG